MLQNEIPLQNGTIIAAAASPFRLFFLISFLSGVCFLFIYSSHITYHAYLAFQKNLPSAPPASKPRENHISPKESFHETSKGFLLSKNHHSLRDRVDKNKRCYTNHMHLPTGEGDLYGHKLTAPRVCGIRGIGTPQHCPGYETPDVGCRSTIKNQKMR